jgi:hypothetical protein
MMRVAAGTSVRTEGSEQATHLEKRLCHRLVRLSPLHEVGQRAWSYCGVIVHEKMMGGAFTNRSAGYPFPAEPNSQTGGQTACAVRDCTSRINNRLAVTHYSGKHQARRSRAWCKGFFSS